MVAFVLERPRAVLDAGGGGIAPGRRSHHPRPPGAARADRAVGAAPGAARVAVAPRRRRRADGPGLRLPEPERSARIGTAPQGGRFVGRTPLRRTRGALPSRHRLQPMRQRSRVPLRHLGARAGGSPPRHPLPRAGSRARAARPLREVPAMMHAAALAGFSAVLGGAIALVAHHAPLTAAVVLPFLDLSGARAAGTRAALVAAAGIVGALLSSVLPGFEDGAFLKIASAVTAGALLHVVADEIRAQRFGSRLERALDLGACAAGLLVAGLGALVARREDAAPLMDLLRAFGGLSLACSPAILAGCAVGALLASRTRFFRWDAFVLALVLLGPGGAMAWAVLTILLSLPLARSFRADSPARPVGLELVAAVRERAPALLTLVVVAAVLEVSARAFPTSFVPAAALLLLVAFCARLDEAGAVVVAAVLVRKGLDPGIAIALLACGPLTRAAMVRILGGRGRGAAAAAVVLECVGAIVAGRLLSLSGALTAMPAVANQALRGVREPLAVQLASSPLAAAAAVVLVALAIATLWSEGVRGWFAPLRHGPHPV